MGNPRVQIMSRELVCSTQNGQQRSTLFATILPRRKQPVGGAMVISRSCARVPHVRPIGVAAGLGEINLVYYILGGPAVWGLASTLKYAVCAFEDQ